MRPAIGSACLIAFVLGGCASMGPPTIDRDRFDYVTTISDSWKRQMVLNLLKIRYTDGPVFMDIASVISSYSLEGDFSLFGQYAPPGRGDTFGGLGATGRYTDKPTITYHPLTGDKFAKSVMAPIPVAGLLFLIQSGYAPDLVLRICVNRINGLENAYGGPGNPQAGSPQFHELLTALRDFHGAGASHFRIKAVKEAQVVVMFISPSTDEGVAHAHRIRTLLGLNPEEREFSIVPGPYAEHDTEIAIQTRSILQVLIDFASYLDVPTEDTAEGRVYSLQRTAEQKRMFPPLLTLRHGPSRPDDAHAAVRYRNRWFWIDDRDHRSKFMLMFLMLMFSLTDVPTPHAPVVTVPAR
jgi:hypothetical protein